jgi:hypothetical protein
MRTSVEALLDVMDGMREGGTAGTPSTAGHGAAPV